MSQQPYRPAPTGVDGGNKPETAPPFVNPAKMFYPHRRCPLCWEGRKGKGILFGQYDAKNREYLRCDQCGHTWTADVIYHAEVIDINTRTSASVDFK